MRCSRLVLICVLLACANVFAQTPQTDAQTASAVTLAHSQQWVMHAQGNGRDYAIFVALPDGSPPKDGYRVMYLLDANTMFFTAVEAVRSYSRRRDSAADLRAIVVGIGYPEGVDISAARTFDLTPDVDEPRARHPSGGADAFLEFIETELKPEIERRFPVNRAQQTLLGHSLGGMFTLGVLTRKPDAFQTYVGMSASFWFGQHDLARRVTAFAERHKEHSTPARVLLTVGEFEQRTRLSQWLESPERATSSARDLAARGQIDHAQYAVWQLARIPGIEADFNLIAGEDHGTVIPAAIARAIRFVLQP